MSGMDDLISALRAVVGEGHVWTDPERMEPHLREDRGRWFGTSPAAMRDGEFLSHYAAFNTIVHDLVASMGGSISAEHGIGLAKRDELPRYKDPVAMALCRSIKAAIDPQNLMNPGKVLAPTPPEEQQ